MLEELHARVIQQSIFTGLTRQTAVSCALLQKKSQIGSLYTMICQQMIGLLSTIEGGLGFMTEITSGSKGMKVLKNKYKGCPIWVALDIFDRPVTFSGWIQSNVSTDFGNAQEFILAQLINIDSIDRFATCIGEDGQDINFLKNLVRNDRNINFWIDLAKKWFKAEWMADCNEQL